LSRSRQHKTAVKTRRPLVVPISDQLRAVLKDAQQRAPGRYVVSFRGKPVKSIRGGLQAAAKAAGVPYGRALENGITFHTLRHTAATILAELDVSEAKRRSAMGHRHLATTQKYTHLRPMHEVPTFEALSAALPIADLVMEPWRRASRKPPAKRAGDSAEEANRTSSSVGMWPTRAPTTSCPATGSTAASVSCGTAGIECPGRQRTEAEHAQSDAFLHRAPDRRVHCGYRRAPQAARPFDRRLPP
jgi:hypothetical protein